MINFRIFTILLLTFFTHKVIAQNTHPSHNLSITTNFTNIRIDQYLDSLNQLYNLHFAYDPTALPFDSIINANYQQKSIVQILHNIFNLHEPNIEFNENQIIISPSFRKVAISNSITVLGCIISAENKMTLPMVNISLKGEAIGTTSNMEGKFKFLIPKKYIGKQIYFSSIGFHTKNMPIPLCDSIINIELKPTTIRLKEIKAEYLKASDIISKAKENISKNYFTSPKLLTAFFRESIKQDGKYIEVSEAIIDIYKGPYSSPNETERTRFVKGRKNINEDDITIARLKLAGGPSQFSSIDIAKHTNFLNAEDKQTYAYHYLGKTIEFDRVTYRIGFRPISEIDDIYYKGELHIDTETFAILSADFEMTKKTLRSSDQYLIKKNAKKIKSIPTYTQYHVDYRPFGKKWILNSVRGVVKIKIHNKRNKKTKSLYQIKADLLITNAIDGRGHQIKYSETFKPNFILADKITNHDVNFWKNYNVISPEESLQKIFKSTTVEINVVPQLEKTRP